MPPSKRPPVDSIENSAKRARHQPNVRRPSPDCVMMDDTAWWLQQQQQQRHDGSNNACRFCQTPLVKPSPKYPTVVGAMEPTHGTTRSRTNNTTLLDFYTSARPLVPPRSTVDIVDSSTRRCSYCDRIDQCEACLVSCERCDGQLFCLFCRSYDGDTVCCLGCHDQTTKSTEDPSSVPTANDQDDDMEMG